MIDLKDIKKKLLSDPEVAEKYEEQRLEYEVASALIHARLKAKMSQADVAKAMHTSQSQIARMESGGHYPSLQSIARYADAVNQAISIDIRPHAH